MTIDRGGLNYRIRIEDQFSTNLGKFNAGVKTARAEWKGLRSDLERPIADSGIENQTRKTTNAIDAQRKASIRNRRAVQQETRQQQAKTRALKDQDRAARRKEASDKRGIIATRQQFTVERRLLSVQEQNRRAVEAITRARDKSNQIAARQRAVSRENISLTTRERRELGLLTKAEERQIRVKRERLSAVDRLRRANRAASNERLAQLRAETIAQERVNRARQKELVNAALLRRGRGDLIAGTGGPTRPTETQVGLFQRLSRALRGSDDAANRASFTFRRLFGILAAFTIAREVVAGFGAIIRSLIQTSAAIETAEVGLAGLITATTELRDLEGTVVGAEEGIAIAGAEARRQIRLLRLDALNTTATFTDLLDAFQVGLAPGIQAGLDLDEVREFTVLISQAASALGLEQRQLAEEIRSILTGTINIRQTRIAAALGLTNAEIRRAKETGDLIGFLRDELQAFGVAGRLAARTLTGLNQRVRDAFTQTLEAGGIGFIDILKETLEDIFNTLVQVDEVSQRIELNDELVKAVELLSEGLTGAVEQIQRIGEELDAGDIQVFSQTIGEIINFLAALVADVIIGIVRAVEILRTGFGLIVNLIRSIPGVPWLLDLEIWRAAGVAIAAVAVSFIVVTAAIGALVSAGGFLLSVFGSILGVFTQIGASASKFSAALVRLVPALAALRLGLTSNIALFAVWTGIILALSLAIANLTGVIDFDLSQTDFVNALQFRLDQLAAYGQGTLDYFFAWNKTLEEIDEEFNKRLDQANTDLELRAGEQTDIIEEFKRQLAELPKELGESLKEAAGLVGSATDSIIDDLNRTADIKGIILPLSSAFDELINKIEDFRRSFDALQDRNIQGFAQFEIVGGGFVNNLSNLFTTANRDIRTLTEDSNRALADLEASIGAINDIIASTVDPDEIERQRALLAGFIDQADRLRGLQATVQASRFGLLADEAAQALRVENIRNRTAIAETRIENARDRALQVAEREGNTVAAALANIRAERAQLDLQEQNRVRVFIEQLNALEGQLSILRAQRDVLENLDRDLTSTEQAALDRINQAVNGYETQLDLLREQNNVLREQAQIKEEDLRRQQEINEFAEQQPILAGLAVEAYGRLNELSNVFLQTQRFLGLAIEQFAQTASQLIVDIFDPTTDASIKERFARFLQSLAQQILSTLIQLAITAAILNAASGGLLGPLLQGFVNGPLTGGAGFNEGGPVDRKTASRARVHPSHMTAEGRASGGASRARPKGLHPKDTVPIWTAVGEWVIKAKSVAKAGNDAMARINSGAFDRGLLRLAVGLPASPVARAVPTHTSGPGFIAGGRVTPSASQPTGSAEAIVVAPVIVSTEDAVRDLLSGGQTALIEAMEKAGFQR